MRIDKSFTGEPIIRHDDGSVSHIQKTIGGDIVIYFSNGGKAIIREGVFGGTVVEHSDGRIGTFENDFFGTPRIRYRDGTVYTIEKGLFGDILIREKSPRKPPEKSAPVEQEEPLRDLDWMVYPFFGLVFILGFFFYKLGFTFGMGLFSIILSLICIGVLIAMLFDKTMKRKSVLTFFCVIFVIGIIGNTYIYHCHQEHLERIEHKQAMQEKAEQEEQERIKNEERESLKSVMTDLPEEGTYVWNAEKIVLDDGHFWFYLPEGLHSEGEYSMLPEKEYLEGDGFWVNQGDYKCITMEFKTDDGRTQEVEASVDEQIDSDDGETIYMLKSNDSQDENPIITTWYLGFEMTE